MTNECIAGSDCDGIYCILLGSNDTASYFRYLSYFCHYQSNRLNLFIFNSSVKGQFIIQLMKLF